METTSERVPEPLAPTPPSVSKKTLATWKKQLKNLKSKDVSRKTEGLRYCAQDEQFVRDQPEVLPELVEMLSRVKTPDVIAETLHTFHTLLTQHEITITRPSSAETSPLNGTETAPCVVQLHPEQNRQYVIDTSRAVAKSPWKAGEPFLALCSSNVTPEIKVQAIEIFYVLLDHCMQCVQTTGQTDELIEFQTTGAPAIALLPCLGVDHAPLQLATLECLRLLFHQPPDTTFLTSFHAANGLVQIQPFVERPERRYHAAVLSILERFSHQALGRQYLREAGSGETVQTLLVATLETTTTTINTANATPTAAIALTTEEATFMHENVGVATRCYARMLFAKEIEAPLTLESFTSEYASVPVVVETLIAILQRDSSSVVSPPPPPAAPTGNNAAAQATAAAAAATATTLASLFPFSSTKCVDILTCLGRLVEASPFVQCHVKKAGLLPVLLDCLRAPEDDALHQSADKLLHLCAHLPQRTCDNETPQVLVDPQLFGAIQVRSTGVNEADDGLMVDAPPLLRVDSILPILELPSTDESTSRVIFRLVRWLALTVDAPENARALGEPTMNLVVKILLETKPSETILCGLLTKCIQAIALQNPDACELCSTEARNPVGAIIVFMHTAYPLDGSVSSHRAVSMLSEIELDPEKAIRSPTLLTPMAINLPIEWLSEFEEPDTFTPHSLTEQCHTFDPFLCAAKTLEIFASTYARIRPTNNDDSMIDFADLLAQRQDPASKTASIVSKKKASDSTIKAAFTGEGIVLCVMETVADVFKLLGLYSSKNGEAAVSLLTTIEALVRLPGGVRAMLSLARTAMDALPIETEEESEGDPLARIPPPDPAAWPWTREEARQTPYGWLVAPILSVFETQVTCFFQLEAAVSVLTAIVNDGADAASTPTPSSLPTSGVISSVEITISDTDRFMNAILNHGLLVYLITILDTERIPRCPDDGVRRQELIHLVVPLALRLIKSGSTKQAQAIGKRQELLDLHDQLAAAAAAAAASGGKNPKADSGGLTIDTASLHNQTLAFDTTWAKDLLDATFDVPRFAYRRVTALLVATQLGQDDIARALLSAGASPNATSPLDGTTPLMLALLTKNKSLTLTLLEAGASVDAMTQDGRDVCVWTCALSAPVRDDLFLLVSSIHHATSSCQPVLPLDALIELDTEEGTPDVEIFETLLHRGLDVNVSNAQGDFVLHALLSQCIVRKQMRGLDMCFRYQSTRPLDPAVLLQLVKTIIEKDNANIDACNRVGHTALHAALLYGHAEVALYLLQAGANPNIRDQFGLVPLHYACLGFFIDESQAVRVVDALVKAATKHALVQGVHIDQRKYRTPLEKEAIDIDTILERGYAEVKAPPALVQTLATVDDVLTTASQQPGGFLPWHLACGACSHLNASSLCLPDAMNSNFLTNGLIRAAILEYLVRQHNVSLATRTAMQLTGLHLAIKTDVEGSNSAVIDVLLRTPALLAIVNAVHEPTIIDTSLPIRERSLVEITTDTLLYIPHAHVSTRSLQHKYHVILPDGTHLDGLDRHQLKQTNTSTSAVVARYTLRIESAFSALHYALQVSDDISRRLLDLPGIQLQPEGSDLPLLALACAARRSPDIVARLVTPQVNMRVHLPLHDGTSQEQVSDETGRTTPVGRSTSRKQATALHFAVMYEDSDHVRVLVNRKDHTNVNVRRSGDGFTPLHLACGMGALEIIKLLLDGGANLIQMSTVSSVSSGVTPLHLLIKNDSMTNDKLKELIRDGYITREMLLEGLGAPAVYPSKSHDKHGEPRQAELVGDQESEMEISCVLLDEEEHNLSLYNHVTQLIEANRARTGYALRLQNELTKSDDVLSLFFRLINGGTVRGRSSSLTHVIEEDLETTEIPPSSSKDDAMLLEAHRQFAHLKHWHECYAQQTVRSQWTDGLPSVTAPLHRSLFDRRSTRELLALYDDSVGEKSLGSG